MELNPSLNLSSNRRKQLRACVDEYSVKYRNLYDRHQLFDVELIAGIDGVRLSAHRFVLSRRSEFFEAAFRSKLKEDLTGEIELKEFDGETLKLILHFMYNFWIELCCETVESVIEAADFLQISTLFDDCCDFIAENLQISNCLSIHLFSEQQNYLPLRKRTYEFVYTHFEEVCTEKEFLQLNEKQLNKFILDDSRFVRSEDKLYINLVAWIKHDKQNREKFFWNLLKHIDFHCLEPKFIECIHLNCCLPCCLPSDSQKVLDQVDDIEKRQTNKQAAVTEFEPFQIRTFNPKWNVWLDEKWPLPPIEYICLVAVVNKNLIVSNGRTFQCLDLETMIWTELPKMIEAEVLYDIFESKGDLYIVGGHLETEDFSYCIEKYDFSTHGWKFLTSALGDFKAIKTTAHEGLIYVLAHKHFLTRKLACYDPTANKWTWISFRENQRGCDGMVAIGEYLYMVFRSKNNQWVDRYHPSTNSWTKIGSLKQKIYSKIKCINFNERLLVYGKSRMYYKITGEEYNPETKQFTCLRSLPKNSILFTM